MKDVMRKIDHELIGNILEGEFVTIYRKVAEDHQSGPNKGVSYYLGELSITLCKRGAFISLELEMAGSYNEYNTITADRRVPIHAADLVKAVKDALHDLIQDYYSGIDGLYSSMRDAHADLYVSYIEMCEESIIKH